MLAEVLIVLFLLTPSFCAHAAQQAAAVIKYSIQADSAKVYKPTQLGDSKMLIRIIAGNVEHFCWEVVAELGCEGE